MSALYSSLAAIAASFGALSMGMTLGYTAPALDKIKSDVGLNSNEASLFSALVCVGAMIGALFGGQICAMFGRRWTLVLSTLPMGGGWLMIFFGGKQPALRFLLYLGRVLTGVGTGVVSFGVPTYIIEVTPPSLRGGFGALNQLQVTIGILTVYALGLAFKWRALALLSIVPGAACSLMMLLFFPETPQWLLAHGRREEAKQVLQKLRGGADVTRELVGMEQMIQQSSSGPSSSSGLQAYMSLLDINYRLPVIIALGCQVVQQFSGVNAAIFFATDIFKDAGQKDPDQATVIFGAVQVAATAVSCAVMDKAGRRVLLLGSIAGMCISSILLGVFFFLKQHEDDSSQGWLAITSLLVYITSFSMGMGPIPWLIMPEVLPQEIRAQTGGVATFVNWTGAFIVSMCFTPLRHAIEGYGCFWLFGGVCAIGFVFVFFILPETKGKSLEDIQKSLSRSTIDLKTPLVSENDF